MAAYITIAELKAQLSSQTFGSGDDALLTEMCSAATLWFESETGRVFDASSNTTRYLDASHDVCGYRLKLPWDLCSINSITNGDGTLVTSGQYVTSPRNFAPYYEIELLQSAAIIWTWSTDPQNAIAISGGWGYSATPPADVKRAVLMLAAQMYKSRDLAIGVAAPVVTMEGQVIMPATIPAFTHSVACKYQRKT
jgi:hypothetical protein